MNKKEIPADSCVFTVGIQSFRTNAPGTSTAPISLLARSSQPIDHPYWGRIVHDLAGMKLSRSRLPIDWAHSDQLIGTLNKFSTETGDLIASGFLKKNPLRTPDMAAVIIDDMDGGEDSIPYEASINFGGDGIVIEEVPEGEKSNVNGYAFEGPGVIVRQWPLRGVAICPYGADSRTSANQLTGGDSFVASFISKGESNMPEPKAEDVKSSVDAIITQTAEANKASPEVSEAAQVDEGNQTELTAKPVESPAHEKYTQFGGDAGAAAYLRGESFEQFALSTAEALKHKINELITENTELKNRLNSARIGNDPASFSVPTPTEKPVTIASAIRMPR